MRITYLVEDASRVGEDLTSLIGSAEALAAAGHEVTILGPSEPPSWIDLAAARYRQVAELDTSEWPPCDVVVAGSAAIAWTARQRCATTPVVYFTQDPEAELDAASARRPVAERVYADPGIRILTGTPTLQHTLADRFGREVLHVTPMLTRGADLGAGELRKQPEPVRVGIAGPDGDPGVRVALEACSLASRAGLNLEVVRVTTEERIEEAFDEAGLAAEIHESVRPKHRGDLYRTMDVFIGTAHGAGFPRDTVEAMACGVPCVLAETSAHTTLGSTQHALLVADGDARQTAEALVIASTHPTVRQEIRERGFETAARFSEVQHVRSLEQRLGEIAGTKIPQPNPAKADTRQDPPPAPPRRETTDRSENPPEHIVFDALREALRSCSDTRSLDALESALDAGISGEIAHQRGLMLYAFGDVLGATKQLERALDGATDPAEAYNDYGVALFACGRQEEAIDAFQNALSIRPDHPEARANLADCSRTARASIN